MDSSRARLAVWVSVAITVALYVVPYGHTIGYPLVLLSTIAHESGHGVAAVLVGGTWQSFVLHSDGSGTAYTLGYDSNFARAFVPAGGLCGPAVVAAFLLVLAARPLRARIGLGILGLTLLMTDAVLVRSVFGFAFVLFVALIACGLALKASASVAQLALALAAVQLGLSVFSRGDYLFTPVARMADGAMPSDVALMSDALWLPYWFWGALCGAFSVAVLGVGLWLFLRATRDGPTADAALAPLRRPGR
ncbi:MAG: M50 family metallopeptidase [Polyangiales bacterium]